MEELMTEPRQSMQQILLTLGNQGIERNEEDRKSVV